MCGRYAFVPGKSFLADYQITNRDFPLLPQYNISPGSVLPVVTMHSPKHLQAMRWGLIPFWAKDQNIGFRTINARSEEIAQKPAFRHCLKHQRCLIPTTGFFEWAKTGSRKQPYFIHLRDRATFVFAGLYDVWTDPVGQSVFTFTILTTKANSLVATIHHRMPVILSRPAEDLWADNSAYDWSKLSQLFSPYPVQDLVMYPVSMAVNHPATNSPDLLQKI